MVISLNILAVERLLIGKIYMASSLSETHCVVDFLNPQRALSVSDYFTRI